MYNNNHLWMSITVTNDDDTCFETLLFEGTDKVAKDVCRFVSPNGKSFDEIHFEELYKEIIRLRNEINSIPTQ